MPRRVCTVRISYCAEDLFNRFLRRYYCEIRSSCAPPMCRGFFCRYLLPLFYKSSSVGRTDKAWTTCRTIQISVQCTRFARFARLWNNNPRDLFHHLTRMFVAACPLSPVVAHQQLHLTIRHLTDRGMAAVIWSAKIVLYDVSRHADQRPRWLILLWDDRMFLIQVPNPQNIPCMLWCQLGLSYSSKQFIRAYACQDVLWSCQIVFLARIGTES